MCKREEAVGGPEGTYIHAQCLCGDSVPCGIAGGIMVTLTMMMMMMITSTQHLLRARHATKCFHVVCHLIFRTTLCGRFC